MTEQDIRRALEANAPDNTWIVMSRLGPYDAEPIAMIVKWNGHDIAELYEAQEAMNHGTMRTPETLPDGLYLDDGTVKIDYARYNCPDPDQLQTWVDELPELPVPVPAAIPAVFAVEKLIDLDMWEGVLAAVDELTGKDKLRAENLLQRAVTWERDNPVLNALAGEVGLSSEQLDDLFREVGT